MFKNSGQNNIYTFVPYITASTCYTVCQYTFYTVIYLFYQL